MPQVHDLVLKAALHLPYGARATPNGTCEAPTLMLPKVMEERKRCQLQSEGAGECAYLCLHCAHAWPVRPAGNEPAPVRDAWEGIACLDDAPNL